MLSKWTRPSFLQWGSEETATLFGEEVHRRLIRITESVSLTFAGIIGRPLYACMEVVDTATHKLCMNVASMSRFLQQPAGRPIYKCAKCVQAAEGVKQEPGSASPSLRVLWVYPLVEGKDKKPTPLRVSSPVRIVLHAPAPSWGWQAKPDGPNSGSRTATPDVRGHAPMHYYYNRHDSADIWFWSTPYHAQTLVH